MRNPLCRNLSLRYSAKRAGGKRASPNKAMAHMWFMHDANLGRAFLFLDILAECTVLSMTIMVTPYLWYVVGMKLAMSCAKFTQAPFARAPLANANSTMREAFFWDCEKAIPARFGNFLQKTKGSGPPPGQLTLHLATLDFLSSENLSTNSRSRLARTFKAC